MELYTRKPTSEKDGVVQALRLSTYSTSFYPQPRTHKQKARGTREISYCL